MSRRGLVREVDRHRARWRGEGGLVERERAARIRGQLERGVARAGRRHGGRGLGRGRRGRRRRGGVVRAAAARAPGRGRRSAGGGRGGWPDVSWGVLSSVCDEPAARRVHPGSGGRTIVRTGPWADRWRRRGPVDYDAARRMAAEAVTAPTLSGWWQAARPPLPWSTSGGSTEMGRRGVRWRPGAPPDRPLDGCRTGPGWSRIPSDGFQERQQRGRERVPHGPGGRRRALRAGDHRRLRRPRGDSARRSRTCRRSPSSRPRSSSSTASRRSWARWKRSARSCARSAGAPRRTRTTRSAARGAEGAPLGSPARTPSGIATLRSEARRAPRPRRPRDPRRRSRSRSCTG